jgi:eukaryotic-like serine/threonine-protein kinase
MSLAAGTRVGAYEILAPLGAGGMGEVYRARDTRLGREVAIKFLAARFATKPGASQRLLEEARAASALNHPNIVALHDICFENGNEFLVMELVRGKTLDHLIGNRGLAVTTALKYAIPIADALSRAHAAGILHRDLKPSNIMVTQDGVPKILDFGLAQLTQPQTGSEKDVTELLTEQSSNLHHEGIAGTAGYMSPEQVEGRKLDARSDIFSFGAVLYEMITGRRAFRGESTASTLAAVLRQEPEATTKIVPQVPRELERIIQRCLRKDPNRRFQSMSDVRVELEEVREESESGTPLPLVPARSRRRNWFYGAAGVLLLGIAAAIWWQLRPTSWPAPSQPVPLTAYLGDEDYADFSPDDSQVVFGWNGEHSDRFHIYVKPVGSANYLQLTKGSGEDIYPKWSPDGQWIAFQRRDNTGEHTFLISPIGGNERKLRDGTCLGLSWSSDGKALACGGDHGLILMSIETGESRQLTSSPKDQQDISPAFSSDSRMLLFFRGQPGLAAYLYVLDLNDNLSPRGGLRQVTTEHGNSLVLSTPGVAWTQDGREAIWPMLKSTSSFSTLYRTPLAGKGSVQRLPFTERDAYMPAVSHHRNRLVYTRQSLDNDLWQADGHTSGRHPVSSSEQDVDPEFSPDGRRFAFGSRRSGQSEIWVAKADGTEPVQLTRLGYSSGSPHWSPDGRWIVFDASTDREIEIWAVESTGGKPHRLDTGPGSSFGPSFSHNGKWIYFSNTRTGRSEVFRVPVEGGPAAQLTYGGCTYPLESVDGRMIYCPREWFATTRFTSVPPYELDEVPVAGGPQRRLPISVVFYSFDVVPDGIYFITPLDTNGGGQELRFYDFATRKSRLIQPLGDVSSNGLSVSPDRKKFLFFSWHGSGRDLMLVENFR